MNLPKLPFLEKEASKPSEFFLSLVLRDEKASAVIFQETNGRIIVVGEHEEPFKTSLDDAPEDELLDVLDKAVSTAEKNLPEGVESQKTIFGIKDDWISDGKIKPEFLQKLKKISDELEFKPMGFLAIPEAVAHLIQKEEGAPLSGILTEVNEKSVSAYLVKAGKIIETKRAPIEGENIAEVVDKLLQHSTTTEILPSRIILFNGGSEKLQQEFIAHKWSKALPFLHVPQITNLPANYDARSVLNGAAAQMGLTVMEATLTKAVIEDKGETPGLTTKTEGLSEEDRTLAEAVSEFGFSETDIKTKEAPKTAVDEELPPPPARKKSDQINTDNITLADQFMEIPEEVKIGSSDSKPLSVNAASLSLSIRKFTSKLKLGGVLNSGAKSPKKLAILIIPLVLLVLFGYLIFFGRSATVILSLDTREEEITEDITFSESESTSAEDNIISSEFLEITQDGKTETIATGKKETGDKAKGTVTIFNSSTNGGATLPAGTTLISSNDLRFVTDKAITVASASGDIFSGTEPGKADVSVTAEKFGTNYNLPSNTKFTIDGSSSIAAKNDKAFSGGTKKEIKVVSDKDLVKLEKDLIASLEEGAKGGIQREAEGGSIVLPEFIDVTFDKKTFSKDEGDEADKVSLTGIIKYEGVAFKKSEVAEFVKEKLKNTDDLEVDENLLEISAEDLEKNKDEVTGKVKINAGLVAKIDQEKLANKIKGKSQKDARAEILRAAGIKDVEIKMTFDFLPIPKIIPFSAGKIKIETQDNG